MKKLLLILLCLPMIGFGQNEKAFNKKTSISINEGVNLSNKIFITRLNPEKHGWEGFISQFSSSFINNNYQIVTSKETADYVFNIDYKYVYKIARYTMQYSKLTGIIIDNNSNLSVGNFSYNGNFDLDAIGNGIASRLKKYQFGKTQENFDFKKNNISEKSQKEQLIELKKLYEEGLITKEVYELKQKEILFTE